MSTKSFLFSYGKFISAISSTLLGDKAQTLYRDFMKIEELANIVYQGETGARCANELVCNEMHYSK